MHINVVPPAIVKSAVNPSIEPNNSASDCSEYLLVCTAESFSLNEGLWQFALESANGDSVLEASDNELGDLNRLNLLAAVRGLEAIEGSSAVTLLSHSRYLIRSLSDSLPRWRQNDFVWEHFGRRIDVQHADLWRRVNSALQIHRVEACLVSSRLVSPVNQLAGSSRPDKTDSITKKAAFDQPQGSGATWRIDSAHDSGVPAPLGQQGTTDRLRSWLMGSGAAKTQPGSGRRFTAADLVESA